MKQIWEVQFEDDGVVVATMIANQYSEELEQNNNWPILRIRGKNDILVELISTEEWNAIEEATLFKEEVERILRYER